MTDKQVWEGRKAAALSMITQLRNEHQAKKEFAQRSVVYMTGCIPAIGIHPAIAAVEYTHLLGSAADANHHALQAEAYSKAVSDIESLTYGEGN